MQVEHPTGEVVTSVYDPDGHRVAQDDGVAAQQFVYDGHNLMQERDDLGTVEADYTYVPQEHARYVSQQREAESRFYHASGIQDVTQLTDAGEAVTDDYRFDAWGKPLATTGSTENPHTYKGEAGYQSTPQLSAEESTYYLHHRVLPSQGRFLSEDPLDDDANAYRYVRNNPVNAVDPSGLEEISLGRLRELDLLEQKNKIASMRRTQLSDLQSAARDESWKPKDLNLTLQHLHAAARGSVLDVSAAEALDMQRAWSLIRNHLEADYFGTTTSAFRPAPFRDSAEKEFRYHVSLTPSGVFGDRFQELRDAISIVLRDMTKEDLQRHIEEESAFRSQILRQIADLRAAEEVAKTVGGIVVEPLDWINTGEAILENPAQPISYAGLLPLVPGTAGKLMKSADDIPPKFAPNNTGVPDTTAVPRSKDSLPPWLKERLEAGEAFNKANRGRYPHNEVEVTVKGETFRVDSLDPAKGEIVSRRLTQLSDVKKQTAMGYFNEFVRKYPAGAKITDSPFNPKSLRGRELAGDLIFEVPVQKNSIPQAVLDAATQRNITIRDINGKVYNP